MTGTMRSVSSALPTAPSASNNTRQRRQAVRFIDRCILVPNHQRHAGSPKRKMFRAGADALLLICAACGAEMAQLPVNPDPIREKPGRPAADVEGAHRARDR